MKRWPLKLHPGDYLQRYPDGPNAALAANHLEKIKAKFAQKLDENFRLARIALEQLAIYLGPSVVDEEEAEQAVHPFLERILRDCIRYPWDGFWWRYPIVREKSLLLRRAIVQRYGLRFDRVGELGPPVEFPVKPAYWQLKLVPSRYLHRNKETSDLRNWYLAQAAVAPFEKMMEYELEVIEQALREKLQKEKDSAEAVRIFRTAMGYAETCVVDYRYHDYQSRAHWLAMYEWIQNIPLHPPPPSQQRQLQKQSRPKFYDKYWYYHRNM